MRGRRSRDPTIGQDHGYIADRLGQCTIDVDLRNPDEDPSDGRGLAITVSVAVTFSTALVPSRIVYLESSERSAAANLPDFRVSSPPTWVRLDLIRDTLTHPWARCVVSLHGWRLENGTRLVANAA